MDRAPVSRALRDGLAAELAMTAIAHVGYSVAASSLS
jgi:hypothetical protein